MTNGIRIGVECSISGVIEDEILWRRKAACNIKGVPIGLVDRCIKTDRADQIDGPDSCVLGHSELGFDLILGFVTNVNV